MWMDRGSPFPSVTIITFVPFPTLVFPTASPLFGGNKGSIQKTKLPVDFLLFIALLEKFPPNSFPGSVLLPLL
jgi:hypothetical protein